MAFLSNFKKKDSGLMTKADDGSSGRIHIMRKSQTQNIYTRNFIIKKTYIKEISERCV